MKIQILPQSTSTIIRNYLNSYGQVVQSALPVLGNGMFCNSGGSGKLLNNTGLLGVDVPVLYTPDDEKPGEHETVVLVGQDPLRSARDSVLNNSLYIDVPIRGMKSSVVWGTPYALHLVRNGNGRPVSYKFLGMYLNIVEGIVKKGFNVYLTDICKFYQMQPKGSKRNSFQILMGNKNFESAAIDLLKDEIRSIGGIKRVVFFGKNKTATQLAGCLPVSFPQEIPSAIYINHPSDRYRGNGHWDAVYGIDPSDLDEKTRIVVSEATK